MTEKNNNQPSINYNVASSGMSMDNTSNQIPKGKLSYAMNANIQNFDGNSVNYQNEEGNELCLQFPKDYVLIGKYFIPERTLHLFFLTNPITQKSEIGMMENNNCIYKKLVNANCLNFSINYPIHKIVHRITNCSTEIYWTDGVNPRRYLDIDNIPFKLASSSTLQFPIYTNELDCNQLKIQPNFNIPSLQVTEVLNGGDLLSGTYQFTIQYSDAQGNPYTSYYSITNPTPIADIQLATVNFNYPVGKSIVVNIENLDITGQFQYFNFAVIKTINNVASPELVGTYFIDRDSKTITYTGQSKTDIRLSMNDIFEKFPYYEIADDVTAVQDILVWKGLTSIDRINYQSIANQITLQWQTYRIPSDENYADEINATNFKSYLRDEIYPFELVFLLANGKQTDAFHIPGRKITANEVSLDVVPNTHPDFIGNGESEPYWKVYNTASVIGFSPEYNNAEDYKGPYQYGEFAYWESNEEYPNNPLIWGELAGQKIRHHKFPDVQVSPIIESKIYDNSGKFVTGDVAKFPIGVKIDVEQIKNLINSSNLSDTQKEDIIGLKIVRGDRSTNKSIVAKGILRNTNKYIKEGQEYIYPNYPYNDLGEDPFLNATNNAWSQQCKEYTLEIFSLPKQFDGESYIEIEILDCDTNKKGVKKFTKIGIYKIQSLAPPKFKTIGVFNKTGVSREFLGGGWSTFDDRFLKESSPEFYENVDVLSEYANYFSKPTSDCNALLYPTDYDIYLITWNKFNASAGAGPKWKNIYNEIKTGPWLLHRESLFVRVAIGESPSCDRKCNRSGGDFKLRFEKIKEIRKVEDISANKLTEIKNKPEQAYSQIFNSPETSFGQPFLGDVLKVENIMYGGGKAHFVEVKKNAKYKLLTEEAQIDALKSAEKIGGITDPFNAVAMFTAYQAYLTIYLNGITRKNYAYSFNSIADYNHTESVPNEGNKQRRISTSRYLVPIVQSISGQDKIVNNYQRETSVFINTSEDNDALALPILSSKGIVEKSRFTISETGVCSTPEKEQDINVVSYYASMKKINNNQWGQIYSYNIVDTGLQVDLRSDIKEMTFFGGDTFISRFAFKTKLPFFFDNRVNAPDDSDIFYDEIGNVAYPKYWHSARSILSSFQVTANGSPSLSNFISFKAHNFDCPNSQELLNPTDDPSTNPNRTFYDGYMYLFAYGVPYFYCESSYNTDLRQAFNNKEGDFFPHVSNGIPDEWLQETNVSILNDNTYNYNVTFSKQNKENVFTHLPFDWNEKKCATNYPFRAIYSDVQTVDEDNKINNWLIYRALSYYDFPQNYGNLISLDGIQNRAVLARFENKSFLYNSLLTIDTSNPQAAFVGNPRMFSNPPIDFAETDIGYVGSQHKFLLKIPQGQVSVDAKRGQVFLINGNQVTDLSAFGSGMNRFFTDHLPFKIIKSFPSVNIDNHFNGVGIHGVYDNKYERFILTKLDYVPLRNDIIFENGKFYIERMLNQIVLRTEVFLYDSLYFCNKSWTISFNFNSRSWISFHSYIPNFYIGDNTFFYSGINNNDCSDDFEALVGTLIPYTTTTSTTTTTNFPLPTTSTTTMLPLDCVLSEGTFVETDCILEGTGIITIPPPTTTTICARPFNLNSFRFYSGYVLLDNVPVNSATSLNAASTAINAYNDNIEENTITMLSFSIAAAESSLTVGSIVYYIFESNTCTYVPDGYYFTDESAFTQIVYKVTNGVITEMLPKTITTTTTTTIAPAPICPDRVVVIQICNDNAAKEDNFDIYLNNQFIGAVNLNSNTQVGSVLIASLNQYVTLTSSDFVCPLDLMLYFKFDPAIILSNNILEMRNTQSNNNGNAGTVGIRSYTLTGLELSNPCVIADLNYSGPTGSNFVFNFSYTNCCEPPTTTTTTTSTTTTSTTTTTSAPIIFDGALSIVDCTSTSGQGNKLNDTNGNVGNVLTLLGTSTLLSAGIYRLAKNINNEFYANFNSIVVIEDAIIEVDVNGQITSKTIC